MADTTCLRRASSYFKLAYRNQLNVPFRGRKSKIIERKKIEVEAETETVSPLQPDELEISCSTDVNVRHSSSSVFDNDDEFEAYLDAVLCDSMSQNVFEDPTITVYMSACKKLNVCPSKCVMKGLLEETLKCHYNSLNYNECWSICYGLLNNRFVETIDFKQNGMGPRPAVLFAELIIESPFLTHIKLADNQLKTYGTKLICDAVCRNRLIKCLDLSGNGLVESDGQYIRNVIKSSESLRELYLGNNELMNLGVKSISKAVESSITLRVLDLSWNHIRLEGAVAIGEALKKNTSLETVNLAWNGLYLDGATSIAEALKKNSSLDDLDLTCNRLNEYCIAHILDGLKHNTTLEKIRIGQNHVTTKGAFTILERLNDIKNSGITLVDFGKQEVQDKFEELCKEMKKDRDITVLYGEVWRSDRPSLANSGESGDEVALLGCNPLLVLMECMRLQNLRLIDFFKSLDVDKSNLICLDELCDGMIKVGIPVKRDILLKLLHKLDADNNKRLDYKEMVEAQNQHRKYMRKILATPEGGKERTDVERISSLLRKVMERHFVMKKKKDGKRDGSRSRPSTGSSKESGVNSNESIASSRGSSASSLGKKEVLLARKSLSNSLSAQGNESGNLSRRSSGVYSRPSSGSSNGDVEVTKASLPVGSNLKVSDEMTSHTSQQESNVAIIVTRPNSSVSIGSDCSNRLPSISGTKDTNTVPARRPSSRSSSSKSVSSMSPGSRR